MAKDKERQVNPATAALKAAKNRAVKKGKADVQAKRTERLGQINPIHLTRKIQELKDVQESGGSLKPFERQRLDDLEKQLRQVEKARKGLGDAAPQFRERREWRDNGEGDGSRNVLGKRRRGSFERRDRFGDKSESSETDEDVKDIPWPSDEQNMPPIPRARRPQRNQIRNDPSQPLNLSLPSNPTSQAQPHPPQPEAKKVYSSAPVLRDFTKESTTRFMPAAVASKLKAAKGQGGLLEPEELDRLEKLGYLKSAALKDAEAATDAAEQEARLRIVGREVQQRRAEQEIDLDEEERLFREEVANVEGSPSAPSLKASALADARKIADEAAKEAEFKMMSDAQGGNINEEDIEAHLHQVEVEEVSDEDA